MMIEIPEDLFPTLIQLFATRLGGHLCVEKKKKVKFIWTHFHTVIPKQQSKAFHYTLNFINYLQF